MRVTLINPTIRAEERPFFFPYGLGVIAACLRDAGHHVTVYDQNVFRTSNEQVVATLRESPPPDVLAVGGLISTYGHLRQLLPLIREAFPDVPLVLGGGVTVRPDVVFARLPVDVCVVVEGEHTMLELCAAFAEGGRTFEKVPGIVFRRDGKLVWSEPRPLERNLDVFPFPAYELFPTETYLEANALSGFTGLDVGQKRCATLAWSRGCVNECTFCWRMCGRTIRFRSLDLLMDELVFLRREYGADSYFFTDECINASPRLARDLARMLIERDLVAPWYSCARVTNFDDDLAAELARSGCVGLTFGMESGSPKILAEMKKNATPQHATQALAACHRHGIIPLCPFIIGMPSETEETLRETIHFIKENRIEFFTFYFATPFPGSELFDWPDTQRRIREKFGTVESFFEAVGCLETLTLNLTKFTDEELIQWQNDATLWAQPVYDRPYVAIPEALTPRRALQPVLARAAEEGWRQVALYGAGLHTQRVLEEVDFGALNVAAIIEDNETRWGESLCGVPIISPADALAMQLDAVILSSDRFESILEKKAAPLQQAGVPVLRLYGQHAPSEAVDALIDD
ncbi:MAG: radical SAM protein [Candidatus Lernaella stagnicola]|nr:radical SAM protein [Candidatus Lernaella stagnicola]